MFEKSLLKKQGNLFTTIIYVVIYGLILLGPPGLIFFVLGYSGLPEEWVIRVSIFSFVIWILLIIKYRIGPQEE